MLGIVMVALGCDNVEWGGVDMRLRSPSEPTIMEAPAPPADTTATPVTSRPSEPVLYLGRRVGSEAWLVPVALGFPFLRLYLLAEHGRCPAVANMFDNTRTTYTNLLVRFLAWNMPYHVEHHVLPQVPFHLLPRFNQRIREWLKHTSPGYVAFSRDYVSRFPS